MAARACVRQLAAPAASSLWSLALFGAWPHDEGGAPTTSPPPTFTHVLLSDDPRDAGGVAGSESMRAAVRALALHAPPGAAVLALSREPLDGSGAPLTCVRVARRGGGPTPAPPPRGGDGPTVCSGQYRELLRLDASSRTLSVVMPPAAAGGPPQWVGVPYRQLLLLPSIAPRAGVPGGGLMHESAFAPVPVLRGEALGAAASYEPVAVVGSGADALAAVRELTTAPSAAAAPSAATASRPHVTVVGSGWSALEGVSALLHAAPTGGAPAPRVTLLSPHPVPLAEDLPRYMGEVLSRRLRALGPPTHSREGTPRVGGTPRQHSAAAARASAAGSDGGPVFDYQPFSLVNYVHGRLSSGAGGSYEHSTTSATQRVSASAPSNGDGGAGGSQGGDSVPPPPPPPPSGHAYAPASPPLTVYTAATYDALQTARLVTDALLLAPRGGPLGRGGVDSGAGKAVQSTQASPADWPLASGPAAIAHLLEGAGSSAGAGSGSLWASSPWIGRGVRGAGARASTAGGNGLETDELRGGIVVTAELAANAEGVWAAGHGVSWPDPLSGRTRLAPAGAAVHDDVEEGGERVLALASRVTALSPPAPGVAAPQPASSPAHATAQDGHAARSAVVAVSNMLAAEAAAAAARPAGAAGPPPPPSLQRYACLPVSYHALPPPLALAAVVIGSCDPVMHSTHGYFWHTLLAGGSSSSRWGGPGGSGGSGGASRVGLGGARLGDSAVAIGRDRTGIGCGVVFFVAPSAPATPAPPAPGGGTGAPAPSTPQLLAAVREQQSLAASSGGYRVTGAVLWDGRKPAATHHAPPAAALSAGAAAAAAAAAWDAPAAGPAPLAAHGASPATAKATALIQRLVAGTRAQPLSGGPDGAAFALEAAAHAVLNAAMPVPRAGWLTGGDGDDNDDDDDAARARLARAASATPQADAGFHNDLLAAAAQPGASYRGGGRAPGSGAPKLQLVHIVTPALASAGLGGGSATGSYSAAPGPFGRR